MHIPSLSVYPIILSMAKTLIVIQMFDTKALHTHRPPPKQPRSPGPVIIIQVQVRCTNQHFILLLINILWVLSTEKGDLPTCRNRNSLSLPFRSSPFFLNLA